MLQQDLHELIELPKAVVKEVETVLEPNATEEGFIAAPALGHHNVVHDEPASLEDEAPEPQLSEETPVPVRIDRPEQRISQSMPVGPRISEMYHPFEQKLPEQPGFAEVAPRQDPAVRHNDELDYRPFQPLRSRRYAFAVLTIVVAAVAMVFVTGRLSNRQDPLRVASNTNLSAQQANTPTGIDQTQSSLDLNVDTSIHKKLALSGQVAIQNEADSSNAFSIQDAAGNNLLVADTAKDLITIGGAKAGQQSLKVNGDITATGAITSNGTVLSSGGLSADGGSTTLSNSGLTINNTLVCTASGCTPSTPIPNVSKAVQNLDVTNLAYKNVGQTFVGDNTFTGQTTFKAISTKAFQIQNATGTDNIFYVDTNNNRIGIGTIPVNGGAALQVAGSIDLSTGSYQVGGASGTSLSCPAGQLLQQAIIQGGIVTSGSCVAVAGATTPTLQQVYDASTPAKIGLSSASGQFQIQDSASPLATNLFSVANNGASTTYFAVNNLGIGVTGDVNTTGQYKVNGAQIASTNLGDSGNLARLNATQTFTGANTFSNVANSFTGDGTGLTGVNASKLNGQAASYYTDAGSIATGTLNDSRLSVNVTKAGNSFNGASQLVQLTGGGLLPVLSGANLTNLNATSIASGTLSDSRLSTNVALINANNTFTGNDSFHLGSSALTVQDASTPLGTDLFEVTDSTGTTKYLAVSASGVMIGGYNVCTTAGNCAGVGGGVTTAGGTTNKLAKFTASNGIGDSIISDNGSAVTVGGNLAANNITQNGNNVCDTSGNCTGVSGGSIGGSGTAGKIALFTGSGFTIGDSILTQATTTVTAAGSINVTGSYELNGTQVDSTILSNDGNLAKLNGTQTFTGANTFSNASNSFTGDGSGLTSLNATNILTGTLADARLSTNVAFLGSSQTFSGVNNFSNSGNTFTGDGSGLTALNASSISTGTLSDSRLSSNVALLSGTGPQTFTGNNKFSGTVLAANTGTSAFTIQNATGSSTLFVADTTDTRIAIGQGAASYTLDVAGDINTSGAYRVGGSAGTGITCTSGNVIQNPVVVGGIITGGTCVANGGGVTTTLQDAYNNSSSPATITTSSSTKGVLVKAGTSNDSSSLFQVENAAGNNMFNINSNTSSVTIGGATNSATAFQVQNSSGQNVLNTDTTNGLVDIGVLSAPGTVTAAQPPAAPTVTPTGTAGSTTYGYQITAVSAKGAETPMSSVGTTSTGNSTLSAANYNAISWSAATGASLYKIYRTSGGSTTGLIGSTATTSFNDTGYVASVASPSAATSGSLLVSTTYYYVVTALDNTSGQTLASSEVSITTSSAYKTVTLSWSPVAGARSYRVYRGTSSGGENTYYSAYTNSYTDTGATGTSASPPSTATASANNIGNGANATITVGNAGTSTAQIYVGGSLPSSALSTFTTDSSPVAVLIQGSYAYVTNGTTALQVIDISNPSAPVTLSNKAVFPSSAKNMVIRGSYAYVADNGGGLDIVDISNPASPVLKGTLSGLCSATCSVGVQGSYTYLTDNSNYVSTVDISNPASPVLVGKLYTGTVRGYGQIAAQNHYLYAPTYTSSLQVIDISNPTSPALGASVVGKTGNSTQVYVQGKYAYMVGASTGLQIFDISNPSNPVYVSYLAVDTPFYGDGITVQGRYAYIAGNTVGSLNVVDVSNPYNPVLVGAITSGSGTASVAVQGRYAYVVNNTANTFQVFDMGGEYAQNLQAGSTETSTLAVDNGASIFGDTSIQGGLNVGQGVQVAGNIASNGNIEVGGVLQGSPMSTTYASLSIAGTSGSTSYSYEVVPVGAYGTAMPSPVATITTGNAALSTTNYISIIWVAVTGATSYNVYRTASGGTPSSTGFIGSTASNSLKDTGLSASGSLPTNTDSSGLLKVSGGLQVQNSSSTALLWSSTSTMQVAVNATYSSIAAPSFVASALQNAPSAPTVTATGTTGSKTYAYEVAAVTSQGLVSVASSAGSTSSGNATLSGINYNAISWSSVSGASYYNIYRTSSNGTPSDIGLIGNTTGTSFNDTGISASGSTPSAAGLTSGTTYYYKITAIDANGGETTPSGQGAVSVTASGQSVLIQWSPVPGATAYRIYRGTTSNQETGYYVTAGVYSSSYLYYLDTGSPMANTTATPPVVNTAYKGTNNANNNLQLTVGGNGTPTGQLYVSGTVPSGVLGSAGTQNSPTAEAVQGRYAYVGTASGYFQVFDINNPASPLSISSVHASGGVTSVTASGRYAYITDNGAGFIVFDISNPYNPVMVGSGSANNATDVAVSGRYAYVVENNTNATLQVFDISNPAKPVSVAIVPTVGTPNSVSVVGRYVYVGGLSSSVAPFQIFDVSNPANPVSVSTYNTAGVQVYSSAIVSHYAYLVGNNYLRVLDISNPYKPILVNTITTTNAFPGSITIQGRYAYLVNRWSTSSLQVFDLSNPSMPTSIGNTTVGGSLYQVAVYGRYAYAVNYDNSALQTFDLGGEYTQQLEAGGAELGSLQVDTNEQIAGDSSIQGSLSVGQNIASNGSLGIAGGASIQGSAILGGGANQLSVPSAPTVTPTGTTGSTTYKYAITAINAYGGETTASPTTTITNGNATLSGTNYNAISWSAVSGATGYKVYYISGATYYLLFSTTSTSINDTGTVTGYSGNGAPPKVNTTGQLTVQGSALFANSTNSASAFQVQTSSGVNVLNADTTNQEVNIISLSTPGTVTAMQAPAAPTVTPTGTAGSTTYNYVVTAVSSNGAETLTTAAGTTATGNATLSATNYNALSWSAVSGASLYKIYRTTGGSTQGLVGSATSTSFNDTGFTASAATPALASSGSLLTSTTYYYKVTALDSTGGETAASSEVSATTSSTNTTLTLSWAPISGARSYRVYSGTSAGGESAYYTTYTNFYTDTGSTGTSASVPTLSSAYSNNINGGSNGDITLGSSNNSVGQIYVGATVPSGSVGQISTGDSNMDCAPKSGFLFCVDASIPGLVVYDVTNPSNPTKVTSIATLTNPDAIVLKGNYAYVTDGYLGYGVQIFDISNPGSLSLVSTTTTQMSSLDARPQNLAVYGHYAYIFTANKNSLQVLDIANPTSPVWVENMSVAFGSYSGARINVIISGKYLFLPGASSTLVYDLSNPAAPNLVSTLNIVVNDIQGRYAFSYFGSNFAVYDISQLSSPSLVSYISYTNGSNCTSIAARSIVIGRYAYVACGGTTGTGTGYVTVDISNILHPIILGVSSLGVSSQAINEIISDGRYLYATVNNGTPYRLFIFDLGGEYAQVLQAGNAETGKLSVDGDTTIGGNSSIQGALAVGGPVQVAGNLGLSGGASIQGGIVLGGGGNQLSTPAAPTVTPTGTAGSTTYSYVITAMNAYGGETTASSTGTTATGNATLSGTNYNALSWTAVSGATGYKIYRTVGGSSTGLIGTSTTNSFNDTGLNGASTTSAPTINTTGQLTVQGSALFKNVSNSTTAFQIQNSSGTSLFAADTSGMTISISGALSTTGNVTVGGLLNLSASGIHFNDGTVQTTAASAPQYVTSLPGSPTNGQEIYYDVDPTNGIVWHLRYNSSEPTYHWEVVGDATPMSVESSATYGSTGLVNTDDASVRVTLPASGDYQITSEWYGGSSGNSFYGGWVINGSSYTLAGGGGGGGSQMYSRRVNGLSASSTVDFGYSSNIGGGLPAIRVTPIRIN